MFARLNVVFYRLITELSTETVGNFYDEYRFHQDNL